MPLSRAGVSGFALTVALSVSGVPVFSRDEAWGGYAWQHYQGSGYDAGYGEPGRLPYDADAGASTHRFGTAPQSLEPSGAYGSPPIQAPGGAGYGDYRDVEPDAWRQGGYRGLQREVAPGFYRDPPRETYPGYRFRGDPPTHWGHWQSPPDATGYRFRPLTEQERGRLDQGPYYRPRYPQDTAAQGAGEAPFRGEPLLQPEAAYGFEPNPWRAR